MAQRSTKQHKVVAEESLAPSEFKRVTLGTFPIDNLPAGFSVELHPEPDPAKSVALKITTVETDKAHKFVCFMHNYGIHAVKATVRLLARREKPAAAEDIYFYNGGEIELRAEQ